MNKKIKILKNGPYLVSGNVPLSEKIITPKGNGYEYKEGCIMKQNETYTLCRCGSTKNHPFCDGTHLKISFNGKETASGVSFKDRAVMFDGRGIDLLDDGRCALARFCHRENGDAWELTEDSDDEFLRDEAITAARECPAGRLLAITKAGEDMETVFDPCVEILQDPEEGVSGPIYVKGNIPVESADGYVYEIRNRLTLCRCGKSKNKPFCDASHIKVKFTDRKFPVFKKYKNVCDK